MGIRSCLATLLVVLCVAASARAQGSAEDYRRADRLARELPGLVLNESIDPRWITRSKVVYRLQTAPDRARYWLMDAETLFPVPAFDHNAAARAFARGRGALSPDRLPVVTVRAADQDRDGTPLLIVLDDGRLFEAAPGGGEFNERQPEDVASIGLQPTRVRRSSDDGGDTSLVVVNRAGADVRMVWLDRSGGARGYGEVDARSSRRQHTFVGHVWRIENTDGESLGVYEAEHDGVNVIVINDTTPQETPDEPAEDRRPPNVSPDGRWRLEVREHNVTRIDTETGAESPITRSGTAEAPFVESFLFSPDSKRVALLRQREAQRRTVTLVDAAPEDQLQPKRHEFQYLKPGDRIEDWWPVLASLETGERTEIDRALFPSPWWRTSPRWADDSSAFFFVYFERGSQARRVIRVDAETGEARAVIDEQADGTFIDGTQKTFIQHVHNEEPGAGLPAHEIIWMSERSGWNHLYRVDGDSGEVLNAITSGEWVVRGVERVDAERRQIVFRAMGRYTADDPTRDPYHLHFGRVNFDGSGLTWLTEADGTHTLSFEAERPYYIAVHSRVDRGPTHEMRRTSDGRLMATLADAGLSPLRAAGWRAPERFVAKGRDGTTDIWGHIVTPSNFDPSRKYPVIEQIYAGPHGNHVPKRFRAWRAVHSLAELGFVVVQIDGMGTNWRSKAFHDVAWRNVADAGFPDRTAWIEAAAAQRPWMDLSRVGIYGGSAGGQNALGALLFHGDFYHAAAADCGCHDNRMDKLWWNEAWMGYPVGPHFGAQSNVTNAHKLRGGLLLTVGALDRNVDPSSTMQVVQALIEADKDFELVVFPALGHGAGESAYGVRRRNDFFVRELLGREPRWTRVSEGERNASD